MNRQVAVRDFYHSIKDLELRKEFLRLMVEWDGSKSVYDAFYSIDVLQMKLKEAKENK